MKTLCILFFLNFSYSFLNAQSFLIDSDGNLLEISYLDNGSCDTRFIAHFGGGNDIAITKTGRLFLMDVYLYELDTISDAKIEMAIFPNGDISGNGLVAFDENLLLFDVEDTLYSYNIQDNDYKRVGSIGYYCNGDFALKSGRLFMISSTNNLIAINLELNQDELSITSVSDLGTLFTEEFAVYGIMNDFMDCTSSSDLLILFAGFDMYSYNLITNELKNLCLTNRDVYGAASMSDFYPDLSIHNFPNIFTPNEDGINDLYELDDKELELSSFTVLNRWGNVVWEKETDQLIWDGKSKGEFLEEGVYYFISKVDHCPETALNGFITIAK